MHVPERRDRDPVREVEVRPPDDVVQAVALAVAPLPLEISAEDRGQAWGDLGGGLHVPECIGSTTAILPRPCARPRTMRRMVDFTLTDENRLVQGAARAFAEAEILPYIREWDEKGEVHREVFEKMAAQGFLGAPIPEAYGGGGMDYLSFAILCEELERADTAFRVVQSVHVGLNSLALLQWGTEEQRQRWLVPQAKGEKLATFGLTEPGVGTDAASLQTTARRDGAGYRLNGQKIWISLADLADHFLVFASVDRSKKHKGVTAFLLERGMQGLSTGTLHGKLGIRAGNTGLINLDDVAVPEEHRIGDEGEGFLIAMSAIDQGRFTVAAGAVGLAQACLDASVAYAHERHTFGQEIGEHQLVKQMIARMAAGTEMGRLLVWRAAWLKNQGLRNTRETSLAKWHATEHSVQSALDAIQIHGANGYSNEFPVERYLRNSKAAVIYEGTSQLHTLIQADYALGYREDRPLRCEPWPAQGWERSTT
jgi:glutaryl-CoA dehydrogenase (non-decarboxylating)